MRYVNTLLLISALFLSQTIRAEDAPPQKNEQAVKNSFNPNAASQLQYLSGSGRVRKAIELYRQMQQEEGKHKTELLRAIGVGLLESGATARDPEIQLLTLFGAGISLDERTSHILSNALESEIPELNLIALNFISSFSQEDSEQLLLKALRSNWLPIRLEAIHKLSIARHPMALVQAEALLFKLEGDILGLFSDFFLLMDDPKANRQIKKLLMHKQSQVRVPTVLNVARHRRDDFLPMIRSLSFQLDVAQLEACSFAFGAFKDETSIKRLETLARHPSEQVRLAALKALFLCGEEERKEDIIALAKGKNLFAIASLSEIPGTEDVLATLSQDGDLLVRLNASIALLEMKDSRSLRGVAEILMRDSRDLAISKSYSFGKTLFFYKTIPSAKENLADAPLLAELSLKHKESLLGKASLLKEREFLLLAKTLFERRQDDLAPELSSILEKMQTEQAIALLKQASQLVGAPLVRSYANLALYRLGVEGPYFDNLRDWIQSEMNIPMIQLRPLLPLQLREETSRFDLSWEERSRLLVESFESFARTQDERGLDILLNMIAYGNAKNRYALAGILLRSSL